MIKPEPVKIFGPELGEVVISSVVVLISFLEARHIARGGITAETVGFFVGFASLTVLGLVLLWFTTKRWVELDDQTQSQEHPSTPTRTTT